MKKSIINLLFLIMTVMHSSSTLTVNHGQDNFRNNLKLLSSRSINHLWSSDINRFIDNNYNSIKGSKQIVKYYKVGIMGHRQVINFGTGIKMITKEVEKLTDNLSYGAVDRITLDRSTTYTITNRVISSKNIKIGILRMISAGINLLDIVNYGTETQLTTVYEFGTETMYSETLTKDYTLSIELNLNNLLPGKLSYSFSRIALIIEVPVVSSYTEEQKLFSGWKKLKNTEVTNYNTSFYITDICSFVYNDSTFGDRFIGEFRLNEVIKVY